MIRRLPFLPLLAALLPAQTVDRPPRGYPERDILSPFRACDEPCEVPAAVFQDLRVMRQQAEQAGARLSFDERGREICDDPAWRQARERLEKLTVDAGHLAAILRKSSNADERDLALYGMFWSANPAHVLNLIAHIPGEPEQRARQKAYPRAIAYLRAHAGRRWGDLSEEEKTAMNLPEIGSPAATAAGLTRPPRDDDHLYAINLKPFFQLLDLDSAMDQAQGLWFLEQCFLLRKDLGKAWLEPALPRLRQLLVSAHEPTRRGAVGILAALAPRNLPAPAADAGREHTLEWAGRVIDTVFPRVRVVSEGLVLLYPGQEREAMARAGREALRAEGIGDPVSGTTKAGAFYRGFRVGRVPDELQALPLQAGAVITSVNGIPIDDGKQLLKVIEEQLARGARRALVVEYLVDGKQKALELRIM